MDDAQFPFNFTIRMSSEDEKLDTVVGTSKEAKAFVRDHERRIKRRFFAVRICFTFVLVACIAVIWTGLVSPLIISYFVQPSTSNLTRPYYEQLNQLFNGTNSNLTCNKTGSALNVTCPPLYVFSCPKCAPICGLWHPFGENYFLAFRAIAIFTSIIDLLFATVGAIIFVRVPGSLHFPKIIYLFLFFSLIILSTVLTIASIMGPHRFFCDLRNEDYETVAASPSLLVSILGAVSHYSYVSFNVCFLVAAFNIFIIIYFPRWRVFKAANQRRLLVFIEFIACICLPVILPITHLSITHQYSFTRLPLLPFPLGDPLTPFLMVLGPLLLFTGVALTLIALSIYRVQILKYVIYMELVNFNLRAMKYDTSYLLHRFGSQLRSSLLSCHSSLRILRFLSFYSMSSGLAQLFS